MLCILLYIKDETRHLHECNRTELGRLNLTQIGVIPTKTKRSHQKGLFSSHGWVVL